MKTQPIKVECLECGRKFQTRSTLPSCPKCGGVDVDLRTPAGVPNALRPRELDPEEVAEGARELSWRHPEARERR